MDNTLKFSQDCINLIASCEGYKAAPYKDIVGIPTIGYGSTYYCDGTKVTLEDKAISKDYANQILLCNLNKNFLPCIQKTIKTNINQHMIDALGCFVYNIGCNAFAKSSLARNINDEATPDVIKQSWMAWNHAGGNVVDGLTKRREKEISLFYS